MEITGLKQKVDDDINKLIAKFVGYPVHPTAKMIKPYINAHRKFLDDRYYVERQNNIFYSFAKCMAHDDISNSMTCIMCGDVSPIFYWREEYNYDYVCNDCSND